MSPTNQSVQPNPQLRAQPLVSVHLAPLPLHVASRRRTAVHLVMVAPVLRRLRQPAKQPQKRLGVPVSNIEVRPTAAVPLFLHRRPYPRGPAVFASPRPHARPRLIERSRLHFGLVRVYPTRLPYPRWNIRPGGLALRTLRALAESDRRPRPLRPAHAMGLVAVDVQRPRARHRPDNALRPTVRHRRERGLSGMRHPGGVGRHARQQTRQVDRPGLRAARFACRSPFHRQCG